MHMDINLIGNLPFNELAVIKSVIPIPKSISTQPALTCKCNIISPPSSTVDIDRLLKSHKLTDNIITSNKQVTPSVC